MPGALHKPRVGAEALLAAAQRRRLNANPLVLGLQPQPNPLQFAQVSVLGNEDEQNDRGHENRESDPENHPSYASLAHDPPVPPGPCGPGRHTCLWTLA